MVIYFCRYKDPSTSYNWLGCAFECDGEGWGDKFSHGCEERFSILEHHNNRGHKEVVNVNPA